MKCLFVTSTYGIGFQPTLISGQYSIKIYTGGLAGKKTAGRRVAKEIENFMEGSKYSNYLIVKRIRKWIPLSYYEYHVQFM